MLIMDDTNITTLGQVRQVLASPQAIAFKGMIHCARCGSAVVFERKKGLYIYGHCCCQQYKSMNFAQKRLLLDYVCSNFLLDGKKLVPEWRKPFQQLAGMAFCPNWLRD